MGCANSDFQADFFNNIAAIAIVLLFAKVVTHRTRKGSSARGSLALLHRVSMIGAGLAIAVSLWATDTRRVEPGFHTAAWWFLAAAGVGLLADTLIEDLGGAFKGKKSNADAQLGGTDPTVT
jgi:hypothetical protein